MPSIDPRDGSFHRRPLAPSCAWAGLAVAGVAAAVLAGCATGVPEAVPSTTTGGVPAAPGPGAVPPPASNAAAVPGAGVGAGGAPAVAAAGVVRLPPAPASRTWEEFRLQAARRMVAANPTISHTGPVKEPLLAIPVLEVDLNADGSVRRIQVLRRPGQAPDTVQMAIDAVQRGGPYGDVSRLPRPWRFTEAFLFNDDRRFKPRTLEP